MNGEQALVLARARHIDNDFMRGQRQQLIIEAIAKKALSLNSVTKNGRFNRGSRKRDGDQLDF
ncbi:hypothetical protein GCM10020331_037990 [Ectobacillus funiculus]